MRILLASVLAGIVTAAAGRAAASPTCPTLAEARATRPGSYLHWHGQHCWAASAAPRRYDHQHKDREYRRAARRAPADPAPRPHVPTDDGVVFHVNLQALDLTSTFEERWRAVLPCRMTGTGAFRCEVEP